MFTIEDHCSFTSDNVASTTVGLATECQCEDEDEELEPEENQETNVENDFDLQRSIVP